MRTGRPKEALLLTEEERDRLQSMAHRAREPAAAGAASADCTGVWRWSGQSKGCAEVARLAGYGGKMASPISESPPGRPV